MMVDGMQGPSIIERTMSSARIFGSFPIETNYHPRSDTHSKVTCWAVLFDLLLTSPIIREQAKNGNLAFGVNHKIVDYSRAREKNLDLVLCRPNHEIKSKHRTFADLAEKYGLSLSPEQWELLGDLPDLREAGVGQVLVALEAKACMTEHGKAGPRLFDELNSSQQIVHGASSNSLAVGVVTINTADHFFSPTANKHLEHDASLERVYNQHSQPRDTERVVGYINSLPRRSQQHPQGFDALAIMMMVLVNDGSRVIPYSGPLAPEPGSTFEYSAMIHRVVGEYTARFSSV